MTGGSPHGVWQDKVFDDALLCVRVVVQKEGQYVLASTPSVRIRGTKGWALAKICAHVANAECVAE
jgi:hypothetical protein